MSTERNQRKGNKTKDARIDNHEVTSLSWSRRSRTLLVGSTGNAEVRLIDTTHPFGPEECSAGIKLNESKDTDDDQRSQSPTPFDLEGNASLSRNKTSFKEKIGRDHFKKPVRLETRIIETQEGLPCPPRTDNMKRERKSFASAANSTKRRYPSIQFEFPRGIGNSLQIHPRNPLAGQTILKDGSLVVFCVPEDGFDESTAIADSGSDDEKQPKVKVVTLFSGDEFEVFCSAFDPQGEKIYAATKDGKLLGFEVAAVFDLITDGCEVIPPLQPQIGRAHV